MTNQTKSATFRHLEAKFSQYKRYKHLIALRRAELSYHPSEDESLSFSKSTAVANKNEMALIKVVDDPKLKSYYRYLNAIERTLEQFDDQTRQIIGDKYWGEHSWMTWAKFGDKVGYSPRQLYRLRDKVIEMFAEILGEDL